MSLEVVEGAQYWNLEVVGSSHGTYPKKKKRTKILKSPSKKGSSLKSASLFPFPIYEQGTNSPSFK